MIQVIMLKPDYTNDALKKLWNRKVVNYEGVYMREDRTPAEQIEFARPIEQGKEWEKRRVERS